MKRSDLVIMKGFGRAGKVIVSESVSKNFVEGGR